MAKIKEEKQGIEKLLEELELKKENILKYSVLIHQM